MSDGEPAMSHRPVMLQEMVQAMRPFDGCVVVDGTFGAGGYARALLEAADCDVVAIDRDPVAIAKARELEKDFPGRLVVIKGRFGDMLALVREQGIQRVYGVVMDLGVSSMQLDQPERGFSFRADAPLNMRMGDSGPTAEDVVNGMTERELADIIQRYGEERRARAVAQEIVKARSRRPIRTTGELASIVHRVVRRQPNEIDPATRTFQAIRIHINDELRELGRGLQAAERLLSPGGRLVVVSFHSLEDRIIKTFLRDRSGESPRMSRHLPGDEGLEPQPPSFELMFRRALRPTSQECEENPRARSARLRAAIRTANEPWPADMDLEDFS
jgi:16S rRNA (cytosine1402-N4)-methyltransferase